MPCESGYLWSVARESHLSSSFWLFASNFGRLAHALIMWHNDVISRQEQARATFVKLAQHLISLVALIFSQKILQFSNLFPCSDRPYYFSFSHHLQYKMFTWFCFSSLRVNFYLEPEIFCSLTILLCFIKNDLVKRKRHNFRHFPMSASSFTLVPRLKRHPLYADIFIYEVGPLKKHQRKEKEYFPRHCKFCMDVCGKRLFEIFRQRKEF